MTTKDVIRHSLETGRMVLSTYISDLSDAELLTRPNDQAHHVAWQLGHVISAEHEMMTNAGYEMPALPEGLAESCTPEAAASNDPARFFSKEQYEAWLAMQRSATLAALASTPEGDLDRPAPESMRSYVPTLGGVFNLLGMHELMHAGQFVPVRRKLGKPILI